MKASISAFKESVHIDARNRYPNKAPTGSAIPERNEYIKAFFLLPVA